MDLWWDWNPRRVSWANISSPARHRAQRYRLSLTSPGLSDHSSCIIRFITQLGGWLHDWLPQINLPAHSDMYFVIRREAFKNEALHYFFNSMFVLCKLSIGQRQGFTFTLDQEKSQCYNKQDNSVLPTVCQQFVFVLVLFQHAPSVQSQPNKEMHFIVWRWRTWLDCTEPWPQSSEMLTLSQTLLANISIGPCGWMGAYPYSRVQPLLGRLKPEE